MANANVDVSWDQNALSLFITDVELHLLPDLTLQVEEMARAIAPVRARHTSVPPWAGKGYVGVPGRLKASVDSEVGRDLYGLYGDIRALWYGRFLDPKARQLHRLYPFLPTALDVTINGRDYYL